MQNSSKSKRLLQSQSKEHGSFVGAVKMMIDFLAEEDGFDLEKKTFATLQAAIEYICDEWDQQG